MIKNKFGLAQAVTKDFLFPVFSTLYDGNRTDKELFTLFFTRYGERPPEDVGGSWGYHEYRRIMADPDDPEHESMRLWAESQKERELSHEKINDRLVHVISGYRYIFH